MNGTSLSIILVHAAWADGSSWAKVISQLQEHGHVVHAAQLPLTSLSDDAAALGRLLDRVSGPVLLVGHSYAGAVITKAAAGRDTVRGLVYVAAMAPAEGETVGELLHREPPHASAPRLVPDAQGYIWLPEGAFRDAVAPRVSEPEAKLLQSVQKPIHVSCLMEPMTAPAWVGMSTWFLLAEDDRMISAKTQRFMADRMAAVTISTDVDHAPLFSAPERVTGIIEQAAAAVR
jgi:pimeloyl-ACP methyl ester carboxylesterase